MPQPPISTTKPVTSLSGYVAAVEKTVDLLAPHRDFDPWFRGQSDISWPLTPGLYRAENKKFLDEDDFRHDFRRRAWPYLPRSAHEPANDWEWYFLMQHHGLPTRLLDWSESALVALYFAVSGPHRPQNPVVWVLDPWALNRVVARKGDVVLDAEDTKARSYLRPPFSDKVLPPYPIALESPLKSARIAAQRGTFTLHGKNAKGIDRYPAIYRRITKIAIARSKVPLLREQLRVAGITETTVFPELPALCQELLEYWRPPSDSA